MRVFYDGMIYRVQKNGGVNRYFAQLIDALPPEIRPILISDCVRQFNFPDNPRLRLFQKNQCQPGYFARRLLALYFRAVARTVPFDIAHPTYYSLLTRLPLNAYRRPIVITVYDMIDELFPAQTDPTGIASRLKRKAVDSAQAVICISEATRQDLLRLFTVAEEKVRVIPLAASFDRSLSYGPESVPTLPYFLYVGQRDGYKNFAALLTAFGRIGSQQPKTALCIVGPPFNARERAAVAEQDVSEQVQHYGQVSDTHLAKLYRLSTAFVFPSLYEGFGLPILEAMTCGAAVITGNRGSIPEVAGEASLIVDMENIDDLTDALRLLRDDEAERRRLSLKGLQRANLFSWKETAARTMDVYRSVLRTGHA